MRIPFRKVVADTKQPKTFNEAAFEMGEAITAVLCGDDKTFYDHLSDEEMFAYAQTLWDYHGDLRDEWARRKMHAEMRPIA